MDIPYRLAFVATTVLLAVLAISPKGVQAQTPQQMEYERQQREYRQQQEQQRQAQQRQQELMNENARRQQEESRRLNAPMGQNPAPSGYQGAAPQAGSREMRPPAVQSNATAATAAAKWVELGSLPAYGGTDIYSDPVTLRRSGDMVTMWEMWDFKTPQVIGGQRVSSVKNQYEYDCKRARRRMLATAGFPAHMGKGPVVGSGNRTDAWESAPPSNYTGELLKIACEKK
ncbi:MAG: surface-adhesin E family protein [Burkholderiaceae bacterium]